MRGQKRTADGDGKRGDNKEAGDPTEKTRLGSWVDLTRPVDEEYHTMPLPRLREALSTDLHDGLSQTSAKKAFAK